MKTRILALEQHSYWGGGQRVLMMLLDSLRDKVDPLVALPEMGTVGPDLERAGIATCTYPLGGYPSGAKSVADMLMFGPRSVHAALRLAAIISDRQIELVYINGPRCLPAGVLSTRLTGRPSLFCLHQTLSRKADIAIVSGLGRHVSRIVACSQAAADSLLGARPGLATKLRVLYPPVDEVPATEGRLPAGRKASSFTVGMVGRITEAKGHHILLSALARMATVAIMNDSARAIFVGAPAPGNAQDSSYLQSLRAMAAQHGSNVEWAGYHPDPTPYYSAMDLLVVPSICEEGMPLVALEAFQRGVPVVASRLGGIPELVHDGVNGILVPPGSPEGLSRALVQLACDPALLARLGAQARLSIDDRFSKKLYCNAVATMISELCLSRAALQPAPAWRRADL